MASAKEIQNRIKSVSDTMKITNAMYMMSSMKLRKAKSRLAATEPYFNALEESIADIFFHFPEIEHIFFDNRAKDKKEVVKKRCFVVITGDKGMAGAYNHNVIKETEKLLSETPDAKLFVVGEVGRNYFKSRGYNVDEDFVYTAYNPSLHRARIIEELIVKLYLDEELDEVKVICTRMVNSMREEVEVHRILPLGVHDFLRNELQDKARENAETGGLEKSDELYNINPSPEGILEKLVRQYITGYMYGVLVEGTAAEENARMMAMQSATDNAVAMLSSLSIEFNRVRQAAITQEITEVIGGAKALKKKKKKKTSSSNNEISEQ